jgi:hypothetical protein
MKSTNRPTGLLVLGSVVVFSMAAAAALAQTSAPVAISANGTTEFHDQVTGKTWSANEVSQDGKPVSAEDRAFDPQVQVATAEGVVVHDPHMHLLGLVPITAGPGMPIVSIDNPSLHAIPGQRWQTALYVTNNSMDVVQPVLGCEISNGGRVVEDTKVVVPPIGPGERWGASVYGPSTDIFVDRVTCRVIAPT